MTSLEINPELIKESTRFLDKYLWDKDLPELSLIESRYFFSWDNTPLNTEDVHLCKESIDCFNKAIRVDQACWLLLKSPTIRAFVETFDNINTIPIFSEDTDSAGFFRHGEDEDGSELAEIGLDEEYSVWGLAWIIAHELRHGWHREQGIFDNKEKDFSLKDTIQLRRLYEADAATFHTTIAWELKEAGYKQTWESLLTDNYRFMAQAFEKTIQKDPDALLTGEAQQKAFRTFFRRGSLVNAYDSISCKEYEKPSITASFKEASNLLAQSLTIMGDMPFLDSNQNLVNRDKYITADFIETILSPKFRSIKNAKIRKRAEAAKQTHSTKPITFADIRSSGMSLCP